MWCGFRFGIHEIEIKFSNDYYTMQSALTHLECAADNALYLLRWRILILRYFRARIRMHRIAPQRTATAHLVARSDCDSINTHTNGYETARE